MTGIRDAVVFAWFVPPAMPELGEYYLRLLREHFAYAKVFVGMNHGSAPGWEERLICQRQSKRVGHAFTLIKCILARSSAATVSAT